MEHTNRGRALTCILCSTCRQLSKISLIYKPNLRDVWITSEMIPAWRFAGGKMDQCTTAIRLTWSNCFFPLFPLYRRNIDMGNKEKKENPPHRPSFLLRLHTPGVELSTPQSFFFLPLSHNRSRHVRHISAYKSILNTYIYYLSTALRQGLQAAAPAVAAADRAAVAMATEQGPQQRRGRRRREAGSNERLPAPLPGRCHLAGRIPP